jgi:hypothetical protein
MNLWIGSVLVFMVNLPFGYWRARTKRFSAQWILAIHLPIPLVICIRIFGEIGWEFVTFPLLIGSFFAGQWAGGRLLGQRRGRDSTRNKAPSVKGLSPGAEGSP